MGVVSKMDTESSGAAAVATEPIVAAEGSPPGAADTAVRSDESKLVSSKPGGKRPRDDTPEDDKDDDYSEGNTDDPTRDRATGSTLHNVDNHSVQHMVIDLVEDESHSADGHLVTDEDEEGGIVEVVDMTQQHLQVGPHA